MAPSCFWIIITSNCHLTDLSRGHCVELAFLEGKLGRFLIHVLTFLICSLLNLLFFESESKSRLNSDENWF